MLPGPRALVIPFAVPPEGEGLGLGLAALIHGFARLNGGVVGLAQVLPRGPSERSTPLEAFLTPDTWRSLAERGDAPTEVGMVLTGAFQPPDAGSGHLQLLAFDTKDGTPRAKSEAHLDASTAGRGIVDALSDLWKTLGGELGPLADIGELDWEALESVLRAERCALHDPRRGRPHDRYAAMMHLGRAVADAPGARFPAGRLAAVAIDAVMGNHAPDEKGAEAAIRVLERACTDAPDRAELLEATAALHLRLGQADASERVALELVGKVPERPGVYALLAEARRLQGDLDGAESALARGLERDDAHPVLLTERGALLATRGDEAGARDAWRRALGREPLFPPAYVNLADLAVKEDDTVSAQALVDIALATRTPHPELLRRAIRLALSSEPTGVARAARVAQLSRNLLERLPLDVWASLALARALVGEGNAAEARIHFERVERIAPRSPLAADAQRERLALKDPVLAIELEAALRAAFRAEGEELDGVVARARALSRTYEGWLAHYVLGVAERRRGEWTSARTAFDVVLERAPGCGAAHVEAAGCCIALEDTEDAVRHAGAALDLDGESPRALGVLSAALLAAGKLDEAGVVLERALSLAPDDADHLALQAKIAKTREAAVPRPSFVARLLSGFKGGSST